MENPCLRFSHAMNYCTALVIGVTAFTLEVIGITFIKMSQGVYRFGEWMTLDEGA